MSTSNLCDWARILAHAKSGEPRVIGGYRSRSDDMDDRRRLRRRLCRADRLGYDALVKAVEEKRIRAAKESPLER